MESTNLHQLQDQPPAVEASSTSIPSCYGVGSSPSWTPNITLDAGIFKPNLEEANPRSRALTHKIDIRIPPRPLNGSMIQDLGYHPWTSDAESCLTTSQSSHQILINPCSMEDYRPPPTPSTTLMKNEHKDMSERLLPKTLFCGDFYSTSAQNYPSFGGMGVPSRGNFSQIYPSINISNLNQPSPSPAISSSLDLSMQSLDLLTSTRSYSGDLSQHSQDHGLGPFTENLIFGLDHMQHPTDKSSCNNSSNPSHFTNGMVETKKPSTLMESSKAYESQTAVKKSRLESRSSCPPFKVRKEKLGDRIATLQQLVAPFGKTDTASVLMEAVGYIKFLQSQVQTLSVPFMKSSRNQLTNRLMQGGSAIDNTNAEPKQDLRSRGLCLVPLSCMTYIAGDDGSGVWQQPNFGGAT